MSSSRSGQQLCIAAAVRLIMLYFRSQTYWASSCWLARILPVRQIRAGLKFRVFLDWIPTVT